MYKRIERFEGKAFSFNSAIENEFNYYKQKFINEFEYTLFQTYNREMHVPKKEMNLNNNYINNQFNEKYTFIPINLKFSQVIELLDSIISTKLEELLTKRVPFKKNNKEKELHLKFSEYVILNEKNSVDLECYLKGLNIDLTNADISENPGIYSYYKRPEYFLLYRVRNNICKKINSRDYSIKHINNYFKRLNDQFLMLLYEKIIESQITNLEFNNKKSIYTKIVGEIKDEFLNEFRLGITFDEGNKIIEDINNFILENDLIKKIEKTKLDDFILFFDSFDIDSFGNIVKDIGDQFLEYTGEIIKQYNKETINFRLHLDREKLRMILLGEIFMKFHMKIDKLISTGYKNISIKDKEKLIKKNNSEYLEGVFYTVSVNVTDLIIKNEYFHVNFGDVEFLSNNLFKSWQYEKHPDWYRRKVLIESDDKTDQIWSLVHNVKSGMGDIEKAVSIAKEKVEELLNILYFFVSKEEDMNYKLNSTFILYNEINGNITWHNERKPWNDPKVVDELDINLITFLNENINKLSIWNLDLAYRNFMKFCKSNDITEKVRLEKEIIKVIFGDKDIADLAACCAVVIAGSNYDKQDVKYREMRIWLLDDFIELLEIADKGDFLALKERIYERFKVFIKNILSTILFNMVTVLDYEKYNVKDILNWIIYINKDHSSVGGSQ
ncbi:TPA: hypothetical protein R2I11_004200 [Bacillus cereus]|nr:hypothetical protein [Bacillus cereus]